jgi:intracellular sulfur oxidation DsrE/DsrF family protein
MISKTTLSNRAFLTAALIGLAIPLASLPASAAEAAANAAPKSAPAAPATAPAGTGQAAPAATGKIHRIVFQVTIDGEDHWNAVLSQIENVQKGFAPDKVEIEVVTHGNASGFVLAKNKAVSERIRKIASTGAVFDYCANTQKKHNVKAEELTPGVVIIPSGLVQVIKRQEEGWSYIKGGS